MARHQQRIINYRALLYTLAAGQRSLLRGITLSLPHLPDSLAAGSNGFFFLFLTDLIRRCSFLFFCLFALWNIGYSSTMLVSYSDPSCDLALLSLSRSKQTNAHTMGGLWLRWDKGLFTWISDLTGAIVTLLSKWRMRGVSIGIKHLRTCQKRASCQLRGWGQAWP